MSTVFSKIIAREIPASIVYEDEFCLAFRDVNPQAPTHVLLIPKSPHLDRLSAANSNDRDLLGHLLLKVPEVANTLGLKDFRVVINNGGEAGQTVFHLHIHILGGREFTWPPG